MVDAQPPQLASDLGPAFALELGEALPDTPARGVDLDPAAALGIDQRQAPERRDLALTRIADLDREHRVMGSQRAERAQPSLLIAEVRDHGDETGLARELAQPDQRSAQGVGVALPVGGHALGQQAAHRHDPRLGCARRQQPWGAGAERDHAHGARTPDADAGEQERDALGDVGLEPLGGAEGHRGRQVECDPGGERSLGNVQAHVRLSGTGSGGGVEVADVVADHVRAQLRELEARPDPGGAAVTRKRARDQSSDHHVDRLDHLLRHRARALTGRGRCERGLGHAARERAR